MVREADLMRKLVFDFPLECDHDEALCRARFAARTCTSDDRVRSVVRAYRIRSTHVTRGIERGDVVEFFERLALFMCACVPSAHSQLALLVGQWYPVLAGSCGMERIARAESDAIRDDLIAKGVEVMDGDPLGWDWKLDI